jgi:hypothetical protein
MADYQHDNAAVAATRRVTKALRELVERVGPFESVTEAKAALVDELLRLKLPYTASQLDRALHDELKAQRDNAAHGRGQPLVVDPARPVADVPPEPLPLSRRDAANVWADLEEQFGLTVRGGRFLAKEPEPPQQGSGRPEHFPDLVLVRE